jgi:hypothetical protein
VTLPPARTRGDLCNGQQSTAELFSVRADTSRGRRLIEDTLQAPDLGFVSEELLRVMTLTLSGGSTTGLSTDQFAELRRVTAMTLDGAFATGAGLVHPRRSIPMVWVMLAELSAVPLVGLKWRYRARSGRRPRRQAQHENLWTGQVPAET